MPREGRKQEQFMVLVDPDIRLRMDALRMVMGVSRGEVARMALAGTPLVALEREHYVGLTTLLGIAQAIGMKRDDFVREVCEKVGRSRMPKLSEMQAMNGAQLVALKRDGKIPEQAKTA